MDGNSRRRYVWAALGAFQLCLLGVGALELRPPGAFKAYGALTGASQNYRFFAPEIESEARARFVITNRDGRRIEDYLQRGVTRETSLRIGNVVGVLGQVVEMPEIRREVAASWAAKMFDRHPGAAKVTVFLEGYELPSMKEWKTNKKTGWTELYRASFVQKAE